MRTFITVASLVLTWVTIATAADSGLRRTVDLDAPGAIERVRAESPAHLQKIVKIIEGVTQQPSFDARDVGYTPIVMTSHPPKRRLSFALDDTRYEVIVVLTKSGGAVTPAK
jgi:hypothetical protein